jgi:hypothetical protein
MQWPIDWVPCTVLGSGKSDFLSAVLPKLSTHVGLLLYSADMVFTGHHLWLVCGLYSSWSHKWWLCPKLFTGIEEHCLEKSMRVGAEYQYMMEN